jgi:hypothetical protein
MARLMEDVIAERTLELKDPKGTVFSVVARLGKPQPDPNPGGAWRCPFQIEGILDSQGVRWISGEDSYQALILAIELVHVDIESAARRAKLVLPSGQDDLGLLPRRL